MKIAEFQKLMGQWVKEHPGRSITELTAVEFAQWRTARAAREDATAAARVTEQAAKDRAWPFGPGGPPSGPLRVKA